MIFKVENHKIVVLKKNRYLPTKFAILECGWGEILDHVKRFLGSPLQHVSFEQCIWTFPAVRMLWWKEVGNTMYVVLQTSRWISSLNLIFVTRTDPLFALNNRSCLCWQFFNKGSILENQIYISKPHNDCNTHNEVHIAVWT